LQAMKAQPAAGAASRTADLKKSWQVTRMHTF
jgi:hypothetical protein